MSVRPLRRLLVGLAASVGIICPGTASAAPNDVASVAKSLRSSPVYVDPAMTSQVDRSRLLYAVHVASRAASSCASGPSIRVNAINP